MTEPLTLREAARMLDAAMRDKSYQAEALGREVATYLRYMSSSKGAASRTIYDYESVLARFVVENAHLEIAHFSGVRGAELIEEYVHRRYGHLAPGTRAKVFSVFASFFRWAARHERVASNPADLLDRPRRRPERRRAHSPERVKQIIDAQPDLRDRVAIALMARLGLRKNELRLLRWRDVDLQIGELSVHAKGGKRATIPIVYEDLLADLATLSLEASKTDYLLFPARVGNLPGQGIVREYPERPMQPSTMHRWWKRCLQQASAADFPMHELRHTAGNEFRRATSDLELTRVFMRHVSITTTSDAYMHADHDELVRGMRLAGERWATK